MMLSFPRKIYLCDLHRPEIVKNTDEIGVWKYTDEVKDGLLVGGK